MDYITKKEQRKLESIEHRLLDDIDILDDMETENNHVAKARELMAQASLHIEKSMIIKI